MSTNQNSVLNLVDFPGRGFVYPMGPTDFSMLVERSTPTGTLHRDLLPALRVTLLKGVKISVVPGRSALKDMLAAFQASLASEGARFRQDSDTEIRVKYPANKTMKSKVDKCIDLLRVYLGRYGMALSREGVIRDSVCLDRLSWKFAPDLNVARFFEPDNKESLSDCEIHMSPVFKVGFKTTPSPLIPGRNSISIQFQDKIGEEFRPTVSRCFEQDKLSRAELQKAAAFLLLLSVKAEKE